MAPDLRVVNQGADPLAGFLVDLGHAVNVTSVRRGLRHDVLFVLPPDDLVAVESDISAVQLFHREIPFV
jgi:hypothetical protein